MVQAPVGDDVFYDDPTINDLQNQMAQLFGKEAALLMPSGTMANAVSVMLHCRTKGDAAVIGDMSFINNWQKANIASLGGVMPMTVRN